MSSEKYMEKKQERTAHGKRQNLKRIFNIYKWKLQATTNNKRIKMNKKMYNRRSNALKIGFYVNDRQKGSKRMGIVTKKKEEKSNWTSKRVAWINVINLHLGNKKYIILYFVFNSCCTRFS